MEIGTHKLEVCRKCLLVHDNGVESKEDLQHSEAIALFEIVNDCTLTMGGEELGFKNFQCDICGGITENGSCAGDRYRLNAIRPLKLGDTMKEIKFNEGEE